VEDKKYTDIDIQLTRRSLELAAKGVGLVSPNPLVGCVIVSDSGDVVGEGTYEYDKEIHAEAIALKQAGNAAKNGTAYVSLEPHDHHGRTPPCTEALINAGIQRIVCPIEDPNPLVSGKGFERLRSSGIEIVTGILSDEAAKLNERFIVWHRRKRPFVHLKLATSLDGRISINQSVSTALSGAEAKDRVQELRHQHDAILVGATTADVDDPSLTDRSGKPRRKPLVRIVLDNRLRLPLNSKLVETAKEIPTLVFTNCIDPEKVAPLTDKNVEVIQIERGARNIIAVLGELYKREIQSVLVEGGSAVAGAFWDAKLVDKITFINAPIIIGGSDAPSSIGGNGAGSIDKASRLHNISVTRLGDDVEITGYPNFGSE
jgi:diaminohydroxyphosphoribosylaminopyrimidine deaminase/5-amino-6-(5-phosphoribosylamino)uracil reductase